jgi:DNA mismatch repair ATPase MutL
MTNAELDKIISVISLKFLQAFIAWKKKHCAELDSQTVYDIPDEDLNVHTFAVNEQIKQQQQTYMIKINGRRVNEDKRRNEIKQFLYSYLHKPLPIVVELV